MSRCNRPRPSRARSSAGGTPDGAAVGDAESAATGRRELCAGGTLSMPQLSPAARAWRFAEMALLYGAAPFAVDRAVHGYGVPVFIALLPVLAIILMFLDPRPHVLAAARAVARRSRCRQLFYILAHVRRRWRHRRHLRRRVPPGAVPGVPAQPARCLPAHHAALSADVGRGAGVRLSHVLLPPLRRAVRRRLVAGHPAQRRAVRHRPRRHRHAARRLRHDGDGRAVCLALCR